MVSADAVILFLNLCGIQNNVDYAVGGCVEHRLVDYTVFDRVYELFVIVSARIRHFKVVARFDTVNSVIYGAPVADYRAVKSPFFSQNVVLELTVLRAVCAVQLVISIHNHCRLAFFDGNFKRCQIYFSECTLVNNAVACHSVHFLAVGGEMLESGAYPF